MSQEWSDAIVGLRKRLDLTQEEFGRLLGMSGKAISNWERGAEEPNVCWERIIQFIQDCPSAALNFLSHQPWRDTDISFPERMEEIRTRLGWTLRELAEYMGLAVGTLCAWTRGDHEMNPCFRLLIAMLEIYADVDRKEWPPGIFSQPPDVITPERIKMLRQSHAMKQSDLANLLHVNERSAVSMWEHGKAVGWCTNLLLRVIETYPRVIDLLAKVPKTDERLPGTQIQRIRESIGLSVLEMAHFLGAEPTSIRKHEFEGVRIGCAKLVYLLLEGHRDDFIPLVQNLSNPGGYACPIW